MLLHLYSSHARSGCRACLDHRTWTVALCPYRFCCDTVSGQVLDRTAAEVAAMDTDTFISSDLFDIVEGEHGGPNAPGAAGEAFRASLDVGNRPWVKFARLTRPAPEVAEELENDLAAPDVAVELEWVYGVKTGGVRGSVQYIHTGEIVYPAASVGVVYTQGKHAQRFNLSHTDEIISMAVHVQVRATTCRAL